MSTAIKNEIQHYRDKSASTYDEQFGHGISNQEEKKIWQTILIKNIQHPPGAKVLDVGTGTGFLAFLLSEMEYRVTGIDNSGKMLSMAKEKARKTNLSASFQIDPPWKSNDTLSCFRWALKRLTFSIGTKIDIPEIT